MWFELLPSHTTYTLVSYTCSFELILSLVLSLPQWNLSCPMQNNIHNHTCACVDVLHHSIGIWAHFGLCFELLPFFHQCDLSFCLYILHIPWCPRHVHLSSIWAWFWAYAKQNKEPYVCLCWCSSSLHGYLTSFSALSWAFTKVIWAAVFT